MLESKQHFGALRIGGLFLFCFGIILFLFFLLFFIGYQYLNNKQRKIINLIAIISKNQLKLKLKRLNYIKENTNNFSNHLNIWWTSYSILINNYFLSQVYYDLRNFLISKYHWLPTFKNIKNINKIYKSIEEINQNLFLLLNKVNELLEIETVQRDYGIFFSNAFCSLKTKTNFLILKKYDIDIDKLNKIMEIFESTINEFYENLKVGNFQKADSLIRTLNDYAFEVITLIDVIPYTIRSINDKIQPKIEEFKNYTNKLKGEQQKKYRIDLEKFDKSISLSIVELNNFVKQLKYKKCQKLLYKISNQIKKFDEQIHLEKNIEYKISENLKFLSINIKQIDTSVSLIEKSFSKINILNKDIILIKNDFIKAKEEFRKAKINIELKRSYWDLKRNTINDYVKYIKDILQKLIVIINQIDKFENISNELDISLNKVERLNDHIDFVISLIEQYNIKVQKNININQINKYNNDVLKIEEKLLNLKNILTNTNKNNSISVDLENQIESKINKMITIHLYLNNLIYLDFICQEVLVYLELYALNKNSNIDNSIIELTQKYHDGQYSEMLDASLKIMETNLRS